MFDSENKYNGTDMYDSENKHNEIDSGSSFAGSMHVLKWKQYAVIGNENLTILGHMQGYEHYFN